MKRLSGRWPSRSPIIASEKTVICSEKKGGTTLRVWMEMTTLFLSYPPKSAAPFWQLFAPPLRAPLLLEASRDGRSSYSTTHRPRPALHPTPHGEQEPEEIDCGLESLDSSPPLRRLLGLAALLRGGLVGPRSFPRLVPLLHPPLPDQLLWSRETAGRGSM